MNIKLIFPPSKNTARVAENPPAGLAKVAGLLRRKGHRVDQDDLFARSIDYNKDKMFLSSGIDLRLLNDEQRLLRHLAGESDPAVCVFEERLMSLTSFDGMDAVCFSILFPWQSYSALILAKKIRETHDIPFVFGGPSSSFVWGEGFLSIPSMREILHDPRSKEVYEQLDSNELSLQVPDYDGLPLHLYKHSYFGNSLALFYQLDSGCRYSCAFCVTRVLMPFKTMDPKKAVDDLAHLKKKYGIDCFELGTEMVNHDSDLLDEFCEELINRELDVKWLSFASVARMDEKILEKMARSGCILLKYGIESGSESMLKRMKKPFNLEQANRILCATKKAGIRNRVQILTGYPHETLEDIRNTILFLESNKDVLDIVRVSPFTLFPSSDIHTNPEKHGVENIRPIDSATCAFDETRGLKWEEKKKQIRNSTATIRNRAYSLMYAHSDCYRNPFPSYIPYELQRMARHVAVRMPRIDSALTNSVDLREFVHRLLHPRATFGTTAIAPIETYDLI